MRFWNVLFVVALIACDRPLAVTPTVATTTKGMRVCWRDADEGDVGYARAIRASLGARLRDAGYVLVPSGCQLQVSWGDRTTTRYDETSFRDVTLTVRDSAGTNVETRSFEFAQNEMPVTETARLATLLVNALNASPKVAGLALHKEQAPTSDEPVIVSSGGITVTNNLSRTPVIQGLETTLASKPPTERIDVTVMREAPWSSVLAVLDALAAASHRAVRIRFDDVTAEVDLATDAQRTVAGTVFHIYVQNRDLYVTWKTDKPCADVPRTLRATRNDDIAKALASCKATSCFDRVEIGGTERKAELYIRTLALAQMTSKSPLLLDTAVKQRSDPKCHAGADIPNEEASAILANHAGTLTRCAEYVGRAQLTLHIDTAGHVTSGAIVFDDAKQMVWDREKTCVLRDVAALSFPTPDRETTLTMPLVFDAHHHVAPER